MDNLRAALFMTLSMAAFAVEDALLKGIATMIPTGQALMLLGLFGALSYWALLARRGQPMFTRALLGRAAILRNLGELFGTLGYVLAFTLGDLSTASALLQAVPLAVVLGAALFLGETVGWRRWSAVGFGFAGVMIVLRPGIGGADAAALFALLGVAGLAMRDLATRRIPPGVPSLQLSASAFTVVIPAGALMMIFAGDTPVMPSPFVWAGLAATLVVGMTGYSLIVAATRLGEMSVIAPFRYARILFALILATIFFGERPDAMTYLGAGIIVGSGLYAFWREQRLRRRAARAASLQAQPTL
ncbi:Possible transporter, RhaT family, DMT superfamily protein [Oceanicola granulosus HTCC2516]|uniref:Possible transporter, RhaT family, DMT superfamily protein n=1 Tax=Oceanicola granulosus (strain ATCC BAA-861 / DSM 15982 / KCTC 12143 / HTCC2516) TaxID=314256 RepID=Q2CG64_OCEGH|nr:DMT family transporter [Oceanicola granulosus]EAR51665.1 Possible transporter, RhaT family, DMT superfamily protein [Oceanicola granulosus HTCC2516]